MVSFHLPRISETRLTNRRHAQKGRLEGVETIVLSDKMKKGG